MTTIVGSNCTMSTVSFVSEMRSSKHVGCLMWEEKRAFTKRRSLFRGSRRANPGIYSRAL